MKTSVFSLALFACGVSMLTFVALSYMLFPRVPQLNGREALLLTLAVGGCAFSALGGRRLLRRPRFFH